jgi:hypothetical protein
MTVTVTHSLPFLAVGEAVPPVRQPLLDRHRDVQRGPRGSSRGVRPVVLGRGGGPGAGTAGLSGVADCADAVLWEHLPGVALQPAREAATMDGQWTGLAWSECLCVRT